MKDEGEAALGQMLSAERMCAYQGLINWNLDEEVVKWEFSHILNKSHEQSRDALHQNANSLNHALGVSWG